MKTQREIHKILFLASMILLTVGGSWTQTSESPYDIVIKSGMVLDGTGNPFFIADIGIKGKKISHIGTIDAKQGKHVIDATGRYVTPGFIDMHSHSANSSDGKILHPEGRKAHNSVTQGITTETVNPSFPIGEHVQKYRQGGHALNEVLSVSFGRIRERVVGRDNRQPTQDELSQMKAMMQQGFSEGARYLFVNLENGMPDRFAGTDELTEMAKKVKELGGYYDTHQRSEGITPIWYNPSGQDHNPASHSSVVDGVDAVRETVAIAENSGAKVVGHHVKVKGPNFWGASRAYTSLMDRARSRGVQVYFSIYGYTSYGNHPNVAVVPNWSLADPKIDSRLLRWVENPYADARENFMRVLDDPAKKANLIVDIEHQFTKAGGPNHLLLVEYPDKQYTGKTLQQIADMRNEDPIDALIWLQLNGENRHGGGGFRALDTSNIDVDHFITKDYVAYVTDGGNIVPEEGYPHPRYYGIFPRFIRRYALDRGVVELPHMIRGMSSLAAQIIGLKNRGLLREGFYADINVFNPVTIRDYSTYMKPHQFSTGFEQVLINGTFVVKDSKRTGALPGEVLVGPHTKTSSKNTP